MAVVRIMVSRLTSRAKPRTSRDLATLWLESACERFKSAPWHSDCYPTVPSWSASESQPGVLRSTPPHGNTRPYARRPSGVLHLVSRLRFLRLSANASTSTSTQSPGRKPASPGRVNHGCKLGKGGCRDVSTEQAGMARDLCVYAVKSAVRRTPTTTKKRSKQAHD